MTHALLAATVRLAGTLAAENAALLALNLPAAAALLPEKEQAAADFTLARSAIPAAASPALRDAAAHLAQQAEENRRLLEHAIQVQTRVIGVVVNAARASNPPSRYGRSGAYSARPPAAYALSARA